ncbi:Gentisate 1,2-dioxygenase [Oligella ureolytica]|uniref:cupin domain-containing protein n=1 Tax=Oligella ureolytica TaxID=90244 RepID=UPI000DFCB214|nr:cupin domain-containing protein [Oligella ureolytica]SUA51246.1 Gentisate 1,2-dioxygenase [Oligella ureolytica]
MSQLGTLDELPQEYIASLEKNNLVPLWPNMRAVLPHGKPTRDTSTTVWGYQDVRPLLMRAGELTPMEKAERRVLVLACPGHGLENMQATPSIYMGMQLILPNETAPNHKHTPNAVRIIVEGEGATTIVNGEPCRMERGDLILTPSGQWHEHTHAGRTPIVWLDVLDLPLIYYLESSWAIDGEGSQTLHRTNDASDVEYSAAGVVPDMEGIQKNLKTPQLRFPWVRTQESLDKLAEQYSDRDYASVRYINPETGASVFPTIGFGAIRIKAEAEVVLPQQTAGRIFHVIDGRGELRVGEGELSQWVEKDTMVVPGYEKITFKNASKEAAYLIFADEMPLHNYLGVY